MSDWFGARCRALDRELLKVYADRLNRRGIDYWQAHSHAENIVCESITKAKRSGRYDAGPLGTQVLTSAEGPAAERFARIRERFGVTDDDIRWWWDLDEVQRIATRLEEEQHHTRILLEAMSEGIEPDQARELCGRIHPHFDFGDGFSACGLDTALLIPIELLHRIERAIDSGTLAPETPDDFPSYNEFIMSRLRDGAI